MKKYRQKMCLAASVSMTAASLLQGVMLPVSAAGPQDGANVSISDTSIVIENSRISRSFTAADGKIATAGITNKKIGRTLVPQEGSEDFVINTKVRGTLDESEIEIKNQPEYIEPQAIDRSGWQATVVNGRGEAFPDSAVAKLFDGDLNTYPDEYSKSGNPFTLTINLGREETIAAFAVDKRPGFTEPQWGINGSMGEFRLQVSADGETWSEAGKGKFTESDYQLHQEGNLYNVGKRVHFNLETPVTGSYFRIIQLSAGLGDKEEFSNAEINLYAEPWTQAITNPQQALDRSAWTGTITNADGTQFPESDFGLMTDGDLDTYVNSYRVSGYPVTIEADLQSEQTISSFSLDKRPGYPDPVYGINGTTGKYEFYISDDAQTWTLAGQGEFTRKAWNLHDSEDGSLHNVGDRVYANLNKTVQARYVRLVQLSDALGSTQEMSLAEINLYSDTYSGPDWRTNNLPDAEKAILSSELVFDHAESTDIENGKKLTIHYQPTEINDTEWRVDEVFVLEDDKDYMRSFLEISTDNQAGSIIDYIDQDAFILPDADMDTVWSHPKESTISSSAVAPHEFLLGQPVYADGLYLGSEFPAADTRMNENTLQVRYYSGKSFDQLKADNQLTTDGKFVSWQNVAGAARGTTKAEVQSDFYDYIGDIATPTTFRKQYNSWYDNMMTITDDSIEKSFALTEDGLSDWGVEPLDAYVVDDGWNNYYDGKYLTSSGPDRGTVPNRTGFWEINDKFPNDFYTASALAGKLNSTFGVWIGPRGGYNYFGTFASYLQEQGTGEKGNGDICTGSRLYLKNFEALASDWQTRYGVQYWKWDGFQNRPCTNADHHHMTGGPNNMYYTTDMWEAWTDLFDHVRQVNAEQGKGLFINATCYINPSPWLLQWVNTVWLQESGDTGQAGTGARHQQKITYRDNVYYNLINTYDLQFPLKNYYDHDPIYGVSDNSNASDEVFRQYLFANAMRGTAFWELYYSPSLMNDAKYAITSDVLDWAETNQDILKNAKMFGNRPTQGVYGYSAWNGTSGIISFTNPLDSAQSYDLTVDSQIGAVTSLKDASGVQILPFEAGSLETISYGDTIHVELGAHETIIYQYGSEIGEPAVSMARADTQSGARIRFDQRVKPVSFTVDGQEVSASLLDDYHTIELNGEDLFNEHAVIDWKVQNAAGQEFEGTCSLATFMSGRIADGLPKENKGMVYDAENDVLWMENPGAAQLDGTMDTSESFTLSLGVNTASKNVSLFKADDVLGIRIDEEGYLQVVCDGLNLTSKETVTTVTEKAHGTFGTDEYVPVQTREDEHGLISDAQDHVIRIVRQTNGTIKLYVDGELADSAFSADLAGKNLHADSMIFGDDAFEGRLVPAEMLDYAIEASEARSKAADDADWDAVVTDRSEWSAQACSEANSGGDKGAAAAIDGDLNTRWHTNYSGNDNHAVNEHWITVHFNKEETFDTFWYTGRGGSINGSIKDYKLELLGENDEVLETIEGTFTAEPARCGMKFGEDKHAWGIRLTPKTTHNGANFAAAVEIEVSRKAAPLSAEELQAKKDALLAEINEADLENSDDAGVREVRSWLYKASNTSEANNISWQRVEEKTRAALAGLVDVKDLKAEIAKGENLKAEDYSEESWAAYQAALAKASLTAARAENTDQAARALAALQEAFAGLEGGEVVRADFTLLQQAVDYANARAAEGALENLNVIVVREFNAALAQANGVLANPDASQQEVNAAWVRLSYAVHLLGFQADKAALNDLIDQCSQMDLDNYAGGDAKTAFITALETAKAAAQDETALQERIDAAYAGLSSALAGLQAKDIDTRMLAWLVSEVKNLDLEAYADLGTTKADFTAALDAANGVLAAPQSQEQVNTALSDLSDAYLALRLRPSEDMLKTLTDFAAQVESLDLSVYSREERMLLEGLKNRAEKMAADKAATKDDAQKLIDEISSSEVQALLNKKAASAADAKVPAAGSQSVKTSASTQAGFMGMMAAAALGAIAWLGRKRRK